jgi:hypothetical protein
MDPQTFMEVATVVSKLKMYPYFDISNYILMCTMVRDDNYPANSGSVPFSRKHPLACYISSMLLCFAGSIFANFLVGEPLITSFKNNEDVLTASIVWYLINYSPFDVVYKLCKFLPFKLLIYCLKEVQRANKVHHGVLHAMKHYPDAYVIIALIGVVKGAGYYYMRIIERLVRGYWVPTTHEILQPSFVTKGSLAAAIVFILERKGFIEAPHVLIYFGVVIFFVYFRLSSLLLGIHDPFVPFENLFCAVFMGGMWDALRRALGRGKPVEETASVNGAKRPEDKKKD